MTTRTKENIIARQSKRDDILSKGIRELVSIEGSTPLNFARLIEVDDKEYIISIIDQADIHLLKEI